MENYATLWNLRNMASEYQDVTQNFDEFDKTNMTIGLGINYHTRDQFIMGTEHPGDTEQ